MNKLQAQDLENKARTERKSAEERVELAKKWLEDLENRMKQCDEAIGTYTDICLT